MDDPTVWTDKQVRKVAERFRVTDGAAFRLKDFDSDASGAELATKVQGAALLQQGVKRLAALQGLLYANATWSLLVVIQAMDAAGKDGTIKHVLTGVNPQGVSVTSFKAPQPDELAHDFLWRINRALPARGMIGIFNRSHYEEVLITRVHPDLIAHQNLPPGTSDGTKFWDHRIEDIVGFERHLARSGTKIVKIFLNVSREEQRKRFLSRLDTPEKNWKFGAADVVERGFWNQYMDAYEQAIAGTAREEAPWFVVPADQKWFARLAVVSIINTALDDLGLMPVNLSADEAAKLADARRMLESEPER